MLKRSVPTKQNRAPTVICLHGEESVVDQIRQAHSGSQIEAFSLVCYSDVGRALEKISAYAEAGHPVPVMMADADLGNSAGRDVFRGIKECSPFTMTAALASSTQMTSAVNLVEERVCERIIPVPVSRESFDDNLDSLLSYFRRTVNLDTDLEGHIGDHLFVTGATGFLGGHLVQELLRRSSVRVTVLTRSSKAIPFDQRLGYIHGDYEDRLHFVEGDITKENLGLIPDQMEELSESVDEVWHLAAETTFAESLREHTFSVNVTGTENLISFCRKLPKLTCLNHVSTAYVAGNRQYPEVVPEALLDRPERFRNPYEESKWEAEARVAHSGLPYLIYRPTIVLGETASGRCDGQTVYSIAKIIRLAKMMGDRYREENGLGPGSQSFRLTANPRAYKNLIPVDWAIEIMMRLRAADPTRGSVFHIAHPEPVTIADIAHSIAVLLHESNFEFVRAIPEDTLSVPEQVLKRMPQVFRPYMVDSDPVFTVLHTLSLLGDLSMPRMNQKFLTFCLDAFYRQNFGIDYSHGFRRHVPHRFSKRRKNAQCGDWRDVETREEPYFLENDPQDQNALCQGRMGTVCCPAK